jgi:hypothetical protein
MKISKDKKYKTRLGVDVIIYKIWEKENKIHGAAFDEKKGLICALEWDSDGKVWKNDESGNDLIEISPYSDFKIDDKVLAWDDKSYKVKRYFAGISELGEPLTWKDGQTSFTTNEKTAWENCEKYND